MGYRTLKFMLMLCLVVVLVAAYEDVDDKFMNEFVRAHDKESLRSHFNCLIDKGPCDEYSQAIRSHMVEMLEDGCDKCDMEQKHVSHFFISTLKNDFPDLYEAFENKYDPDRTKLAKLDEMMKKFS